MFKYSPEESIFIKNQEQDFGCSLSPYIKDTGYQIINMKNNMKPFNVLYLIAYLNAEKKKNSKY